MEISSTFLKIAEKNREKYNGYKLLAETTVGNQYIFNTIKIFFTKMYPVLTISIQI